MAAKSAGAFLVTGANKGIGFAITRALLKNSATVFLGSRDVGRGEAARDSLPEGDAERVTVVQLDVTDATSVQKAVATVGQSLGDNKLAGIINNAGGVPSGESFGWSGVSEFDRIIRLNYGGVVNVTNAFLPLLNPDGGRVVNISSGAAPMYVEKCSAERQQSLFMNPNVTAADIDGFFAEMRKAGSANPEAKPELAAEAEAAFKAIGLATSTYGASKAALNCLTMLLAKQHPKLQINACSPGFIATDLVKTFADARGTSASAMGALPVDKGAICPLFLALGDVPTPAGQGWYYGSDAKRSPLHKYRSPGAPAYDGADDVGASQEAEAEAEADAAEEEAAPAAQ